MTKVAQFVDRREAPDQFRQELSASRIVSDQMRRNMRKLLVFNHVSLDDYFVDANGAMSFAHKDNQDAEWNACVASNASGGGMLLLGRITY